MIYCCLCLTHGISFRSEMLQNKPYDPLAADIWSLGICLYIATNNGLPFKIDNVDEMLQSQLDRNWQFKKRVAGKLSPMVKHLVQRMLDPNAKARGNIGAVINHGWFNL